MGKAIYVAEYRTISQGAGVLDSMCKHANLVLLHADPICIGKYLICVGGDVADVKEAQKAAEADSGGPPLANRLLLHAHPHILAYFARSLPQPDPRPDAIGIFEAQNASAGFASLDAALKHARVDLAKLWLGQLLGGKFCYVLGGSTSDIQSALQAAGDAAGEQDMAGRRFIASPDKSTLTRFYKGGRKE